MTTKSFLLRTALLGSMAITEVSRRVDAAIDAARSANRHFGAASARLTERLAAVLRGTGPLARPTEHDGWDGGQFADERFARRRANAERYA